MASVNIPEGQTIVKVTVIDTGARITGPISFFVDPPLLEGIEQAAPAYVFLVEHENSGRRILFDLGIRKDFEEYPPAVKAYHKAFEFKTGEEVFDILRDRGIDLNTIEAIVWRYVPKYYLTSRFSLLIVIIILITLEIHRGFCRPRTS